MLFQSILVIEEDGNLRQSLATILRKAGYRVTAVGQGRDALEYLCAQNFDLVFVDLQVTDVDGLSLLPKILLMYPKLPMLALAPYPSTEAAIAAGHLKAEDCLIKPVDPDCLLSRVQEILPETFS